MKVSVITATWNSGKTLCTTLDSVLSQSYPDIEHIIVDGGSTDNTMSGSMNLVIMDDCGL